MHGRMGFPVVIAHVLFATLHEDGSEGELTLARTSEKQTWGLLRLAMGCEYQ